MKIQDALAQLLEARALDATLVEDAFAEIVAGEASDAQIAGLAVALRMKGEEPHEIAAACRAVLRAARAFPIADDVRARSIDTCGTGGDGHGSFNVSTTAMFVVAAAGVPVAKHGNRAVSSKSGSADLLEALGVRLDMSPERAARCLEELRVTFLLAPHYHPALKHAAAARQQLAQRTIFNLIGPLANPAHAPYRLVGVYDPALTERYARALEAVGVTRAWVVHGALGYDELTLFGANHVTELRGGEHSTFQFDAASAGLEPTDDERVLQGGDARENAAITRSILRGETGPRTDTVLLNAAAALLVGGVAATIEEGVERARDAIGSGRAQRVLDQLIQRSQAT